MQQHKALIIVVLGCSLLAVIVGVPVYRHHPNPKSPVVSKPVLIRVDPLSHQVMLLAQDVVRKQKPPPTTAALHYAYIATAYQRALSSGGQTMALAASQEMMQTLYPDRSGQLTADFLKLAQKNGVTIKNSQLKEPTVQLLQARYAADGHDLAWNGFIPKGPGKWVKTLPIDPFTPRAGDWQRWGATESISVPPPPAVGSADDLGELANVKRVSAGRSGEDINKINFWGGTPGSETPAGIWQNQLYKMVKDALPTDAATADKNYALVQANLAQTLSDSFMECWKVKYTYWTARPNMRDTSIVTAMDNPNFPSYISGHSTISKAAADALGVMAPKWSGQWQAMALEARDSRIKAGIHFEIDNKVGFDVGEAVAKQEIINLKLSKIF